MIVELTANYKSAKQGIYKLSNFTLLTGENGSGKTNFLNALTKENQAIFRGEFDSNNISIKFCRHTLFTSLQSKDKYVVSPYRSNHINDAYKYYQSYKAGEYELQDYQKKYILEVAQELGKNFDDLENIDFKRTKIRRIDDRIDLFGFTFFEDTKLYLERIEDNKYNKYLADVYNEDNIVFTEEEFRYMFGEPPWLIINEILEASKLNYRFAIPVGDIRTITVPVSLIDQTNNEEVFVKDMSEGEKTILSIISLLYNLKIKKRVPDIFLFDEPDALLHPNYSEKLLNVLKNYLVDKEGKKVIMTTHSPSTVAIAPDESIFLCKKQGFSIDPVSKDEALNNLTSDLPYLSISHENRRQIFVEDNDDVKIYEAIKIKLDKGKYLRPSISLNFIAASLTKAGGCEPVKKIVRSLNDYGNKQVFGIIDWDLKNNPPQQSKVLIMGHMKRYSIENYMLDPILIAAYLLKHKIINRDHISLEFDQNYFDFKSFNNHQLQLIADFILDKIKVFAIPSKDVSIQEVTYLNGKSIQLPNWYLQHDGHKLEEVFPKVFKALNRHIRPDKNANYKLSLLVLKDIIDELPELIPIDFKQIFLDIQDNI